MANSSPPLVSVLMTAYNREQFIGEAIESVLASTFADFELIIVDDRSRDNTYAIAEKYAAHDRRIRLFQNEVNIGQFRNRNRAAELASGTYLMYADSDDMFFPDAIERCMNAMQLYPEAGFAMFSSIPVESVKKLQSAEAIRKHFFEQPFLTHGPGATIIKSSLFKVIGGFPLQYSIAGDMYYNLNAAAKSNVLLLPFRFVYYRIHEGQELNNRFDYLWANFNYLRDALNNLPLQLSAHEKKWIMNKNRRRFLVNILRYFMKSFDLQGVIQLLKKTNYSTADLIGGLFHKNL